MSRVVRSLTPGFAEGDLVSSFSGWQAYDISDGSGLTKLDPRITNPSYALGVLGMPGLTAYVGLLDIGQPKDYLSGQRMYIMSLKDKASARVVKNDCIIHESARVDDSAELGPNVVIGADCKIDAGVKIQNSTILAGTHVKAHTFIDGSIIGWKNTIGSWVRITGLTCTAEDV